MHELPFGARVSGTFIEMLRKVSADAAVVVTFAGDELRVSKTTSFARQSISGPLKSCVKVDLTR